MVGTNGKPEISISGADNIQNIMEEYGDEMIFMFILGLIVGILITCLVYETIKFIKSCKKDKKDDFEENQK